MTNLILFLVGICTIAIVIVMVFVVKLSNKFNVLKDSINDIHKDMNRTDDYFRNFKIDTLDYFVSSIKNEQSIEDKLSLMDKTIKTIDEKITPKPKIKPRKKSDELSDK